MLRSKTLIVTAVLNFVSVFSVMQARADLRTLQEKTGVAEQTSTINDTRKTAVCRVGITDSAILVGSRFNITEENKNLDTIDTVVFLFDNKITESQLDGDTLIAERRYETPERYCTNSSTGGFFPSRSVETVQTLKISGNHIEITETYRCGLLFPTRKMVNKTICDLNE